MTYQPIQLNAHPAMLDAMERVGHSLSELGDVRRQQAALADAKMRQDQIDFQTTLLQAKKLADSGDLQGAAALMAPYRARIQQAGGAPRTGQGGTPLPDGMEFPGGPAPTMKPADTSEDYDLEHGQTPPQAAAASAPSEPAYENPVLAARQAQQAANRQRARQIIAFVAPGGQSMTLDPEAARDAALEQRSARLDSAFATVKDPQVRRMYETIRPVLMASTQDVDPTDVFKYIESNIASKRAETAATAKQAQEKAVMEQRDAQLAQRLAQQDKNNQRMASAILGAAGMRMNTAEGAAATGVAARFDSEFDRWSKQQDWRKLAGGSRQLDAARAAIGSGNPLMEHEAQVSLGRFYRGGIPTEGEMKLLYDSLAGRLGNAWPRFREKMERGGLSPPEVDIVTEALDHAKEEQRTQVKRVLDSARKTFGPGSGHENLQGNVNAKVAGLFAGIGVDDIESVFPARQGEATPTVVLGKGNSRVDPNAQHPAIGARAAQNGRRAEAVPAASPAEAKLSAADQQKAQLARERLRRNPDDTVARSWLTFHGLQ